MADRFPLFPGPSMIVVRRAMVDGLFGESRMWKMVAFAIIARRTMRKLMGSDPHTVAIERIRPGETVILRGVTGRKPTPVRVLLRNPRREIDIDGGRTVRNLLAELGLDRESHLVIRNGTLVPGDARLDDADTVEIRPVISGG